MGWRGVAVAVLTLATSVGARGRRRAALTEEPEATAASLRFSSEANPAYEGRAGLARPIHGALAPTATGDPPNFNTSIVASARVNWGDDSRLRNALAAASIPGSNETLVVLVLGGSEAQGTECIVKTPGVEEAGVYAHWHNPAKSRGSRSSCSWSGRLSRYLAALLPQLNYLVVNCAQGGTNSEYSLTTFSNQLFKHAPPVYPPGRWTGALGPLADVVLLEHSVNDFDSDGFAGGALENILAAISRWPNAPTAAIVDVALSNKKDAAYTAKVEAFRRLHRDIAARRNAPLVDARAKAGMDAALRKYLEKEAFKGSKGNGHFQATEHEWTAAAVFYSLFEPAARAPARAARAHARAPPATACGNRTEAGGTNVSLALCRVATRGVVTEYLFDDQACFGATPTCFGPVVADPGWAYGEDVPGKAGWVTCDAPRDGGPHLLSMRVECDSGDLILQYLESYDPRMARVKVVVKSEDAGGNPPTEFIVDAFRPAKRESVTHAAALNGLPKGNWRVTIEPLPRDRTNEPRDDGVRDPDCAADDFLGSQKCCRRDKFKFLTLQLARGFCVVA
ncbi:hypothetical protein M885DRAFT_565955 [Pelagophyceae sp. CCMP2097]|nr:hypothetical protein M885DRAFT_565955 [Pelagophyceae sp. CCMP2097]